MTDAKVPTGPPRKKSKVAPCSTDHNSSLQPLRLLQHSVRLELSDGCQIPVTSPGSCHSGRLAALLHDNDRELDVFLASGRHVFCTSVLNTDVSSTAGAPTAVGPLTGKEGVLLPKRLSALTAHTLPSMQHSHEVQSLRLNMLPGSRACLASVDSHGVGWVQAVGKTAAHDEQSGPAQEPFQLRPRYPVREPGWAGVDVTAPPGSLTETLAVTATHFDRQLNVFQGNACVRTFSTLHPPCAVTWLPDMHPSLLACAEGNTVTVWDVRQGEQGGLVQRLTGAAQGTLLYSLAWCSAQGGLLGCAGSERTVALLDPRKWRVAHKWPGAAKYAIHHLDFSAVAPSYVYVAGLDYECLVGRWDGSTGSGASGNANSAVGAGHGRAVGPASEQMATARSAADGAVVGAGEKPRNATFRGDARWLGMVRALPTDLHGVSQVGQQEVVVARTQAKSLYVLTSEAIKQ